MYLLNNGILKAVCWTLVHSLWQGLALAVIAGFIISLTKKSPAALRYKLLTVVTLTFVIGVLFTLSLEWPSAADQKANLDSMQFQNMEGGTFWGASGADSFSSISLVSTCVSFLNKYAGVVVVFWFAVFSIKFFRLMNGLQVIFRLRNHKTLIPESAWIERFAALQSMMKINGKVKLLESRLAIVPVVTGFLKPIILVPVGMLNNLPQDQVEAILLHELAHIRRGDYLYNLLQSFIDMLFFFNPGVLWVSSLIRDERENCCDDMAISVTQDKSQFVHALVSFQEYHQNLYLPAMQFGASKNQLLNRARRILMNNNKSLNVIEKSVLSLCLITVIGLIFAFQGKSQKDSEKQNSQEISTLEDWSKKSNIPYADKVYNPSDFEEGTCMRFNDVINGNNQPTYLFKIKDTLYQISGDVRLFKINGKIIPPEKMKPYISFIRTLLKQHQHQEEELAQSIVAADPAYAKKGNAISKSGNLETLPAQQLLGPIFAPQPENSFVCSPVQPVEKPQAPVMKKTVSETIVTETHEVRTDNPSEVTDPLTLNILKELTAAKQIILGNQTTIVSFSLSNKDLFVNGIKQSNEIQQVLKQKYIKPGHRLFLNYEVSLTETVAETVSA